jgi:hypothetical protein
VLLNHTVIPVYSVGLTTPRCKEQEIDSASQREEQKEYAAIFDLPLLETESLY